MLCRNRFRCIIKLMLICSLPACFQLAPFSLGIPATRELTVAHAAEPAPRTIHTNARAFSLIDVTSGRILLQKNGTKTMRIASLTKIMTAIVAIEHGRLTDPVTVSRNAFGKEGSSLYLQLGEKMSLHHLLYGLMLRSGNDAAVAIAEHVGGSLDGFVYMMNEKAQMIGMQTTRFANPHGLDDSDQHFSTANDMARLTRYSLQHPVFREIVKTKGIKVNNPNQPWDYKWYNKNKLLSLYEGADGVKTGFTKLARRCLVSSASRNGQQLAVVTLDDSTDWVDHMRLFDYGFKHFPLTEIAQQGRRTHNGAHRYEAPLQYPLHSTEISKLRQQIDPVRKLAIFSLRNQPIAQVKIKDIHLRESEPLARSQPSWWARLTAALKSLF